MGEVKAQNIRTGTALKDYNCADVCVAGTMPAIGF